MRSLCQSLFHLAFLLSISLVAARHYHVPLLHARHLAIRDASVGDKLYLDPHVLRAREALSLISPSRGGGSLPYDPVRDPANPAPQSHSLPQQQSIPKTSNQTPQQPPALTITPPSPPPPSAAQLPGQRQATSQPPVAGACSGGRHANCEPASASVAGYKDTPNGRAPIVQCSDCNRIYPIAQKRDLDIMLAELGYHW